MYKFKKIKLMTFLLLTSSSSFAGSSYNNNFDNVLNGVLSASKEIKSLEKEKDATKQTYDAQKMFFLPTFKTGLEGKEFFGDIEPNPKTTGDAFFNMDSKLFGTAVFNNIDSAMYANKASIEDLSQKEVELYYLVLLKMVRIEYARIFLKNSDALRDMIEDYKEKIVISVQQGVTPQSENQQSNLTLLKYNQLYDDIEASIDKNFDDIVNETGFEIENRRETGLNKEIVKKIRKLVDEVDINKMNIDDIVLMSYKLKSKKNSFLSEKEKALGQYERAKLTFNTEVHSNLIKTEEEPAYNLKNNSFIGLRLDVDLFDYSKYKSQKAGILRAEATELSLSKEEDKIRSLVKSTINDINSFKQKRISFQEQIELSKKIIKTQEKELYIDKVTYADLMETIYTYFDLYKKYLDNEIGMAEKLFELMKIRTEKIL